MKRLIIIVAMLAVTLAQSQSSYNMGKGKLTTAQINAIAVDQTGGGKVFTASPQMTPLSPLNNIYIESDTTITKIPFANEVAFINRTPNTYRIRVIDDGIADGSMIKVIQLGAGKLQLYGNNSIKASTSLARSSFTYFAANDSIYPFGVYEDFSLFSYPNAFNPNPELIENDAASLDPFENVNAITHVNQIPVKATRAVQEVNSLATTYSRRVTATDDGGLVRDRLNITTTLTIGETYHVDIYHRHSDAVNNNRLTMALGDAADYADIHPAHTDWQLHSFDFVADHTTFEIQQHVRQTSIIGQWVDYNVSLKLVSP